MAFKLPCIGTKTGGIPGIIEDGVNGFLVNIKNSDELTEKTIYLLKNEDLMAKRGEQGFNKVKKNFTWDKVYNILSEVINSHFFGEDWASIARREGEK